MGNTSTEEELSKQREHLVQQLISQERIKTDKVANAMRKVPRHIFLPPKNVKRAYADRPLSIGHDQTISAPHMVAIMAELLDLKDGLHVLEIGGGSGYHACVLSEMMSEKGTVVTMERKEELARSARNNIEEAGYQGSITVVHGDGSIGCPDSSPYDRILVTCAAPYVPDPLIEQLSEGGIMVIPVGSLRYQTLLRSIKMKGKMKTQEHGGCVFVPMLGEHGF